MIVVADSSPLRYLILFDSTQLLQHLFGRVVVPDVVAGDLSATSAPIAVRDWIAQPPEWIEIVQVRGDAVDPVSNDLDIDERAAIAVATELSVDVLLIDDATGREEARRRGIRVTGTLCIASARM